LIFANAAMAEPVKVLSLSSDAPKEWTAQKPANRLRSHQFQLKSNEDGFIDAEIIISPEAKPDPEKSFPGWRGQFVLPEGKTPEQMGKISKLTAGKATIHLLDVTGTWKYRERPFDPKSKEEIRDDYRVVWALVVLDGEATSLRLSGPSKVVDHYYAGFEGWLKGLK
jgi:hypothetical protein